MRKFKLLSVKAAQPPRSSAFPGHLQVSFKQTGDLTPCPRVAGKTKGGPGSRGMPPADLEGKSAIAIVTRPNQSAAT